MNGIPDTNTPTTEGDNIDYPSEVNVLLSQSQVAGNFSKYPTITIEEVKAFLEAESTLKNIKLSKQSKKNSKVMKFKFLEGKESNSGTPELITATEKPETKSHSEPGISDSVPKEGKPGTEPNLETTCPKITKATEEKGKKADLTDTSAKQYQTDINLSLSKTLVPTDYSKYPRITVASKTEGKKVRKKRNPKTSVNRTKISVPAIRAAISEMSPRQLTNLFSPLASEKLQSIQNSVSKKLEAEKRKIIAAKKAEIEKLKKEIENI